MAKEKAQIERVQVPSWVTWDRIAWSLIVVMAFVMVTRLVGLHVKPFHHDESLYATYTKNLYMGAENLSAKVYDPMLHGPMNFHLPLISLFLFGITESSLRVTPAVLGILTVLCVWGMRQRIGKWEAFFGCLLTAASPVMMYFSRFLREDVFFNFFGMAALYCFVRYLDTKKSSFFYATTAMLCSVGCTKENAFVTYFIFGSFLVLYALYRAIVDKSEEPHRSLTVLAGNPLVVKGLLMMAVLGVYFVLFGAFHYLKTEGAAAAAPEQVKLWRSYWISFLVVEALIVIAFELLAHFSRVTDDGQEGGETFSAAFHRNAHVLSWAALLFFFIFLAMFTSFFRVKSTFWRGLYEWFFYWANQHKIQRIKGPFHYYIPFLLLYEILPLTVVSVGLLAKLVKKPSFLLAGPVWIVAMVLFGQLLAPQFETDVLQPVHMCIGATVLFICLWGTVAYLLEGATFKAFLVYWIGWSFNIYSFFQEKVPWLLMHMVMPMLLLAGLYIADVLRLKMRPLRIALLSGMGILFAYTLHSSLILCFRNEADPRERMVYVQSSYNVPKMVQEIKLACFRAGTMEKTRIVIQAFHGLDWPFIWHLRDYTGIEYPTSIDVQQAINDPPPVLLTNRDTYTANKAVLTSMYFMTLYQVRVWWEPQWPELTKDNFDYPNVPSKAKDYWTATNTRKKIYKLFRYVLYRDVFSVVGSEDLVLGIRRDLGWGGELLQDRSKLLDLMGKPVTSTLLGQGSLKEPKGLRVSSDGRVAVVDSGNNRVQVFNPAGQVILTLGGLGTQPGQFNKPVGVAFSPEGYVVVADTWNHRLQAFDPQGKLVGILGPAVGVEAKSDFFFAPKDLLFDSQGRLYVSDTGNHRVCEFGPGLFLEADPAAPMDPAQKVVRTMGMRGSEPGALDEPVGLASWQGKIFVADTVNGRIAVFDSEGRSAGVLPMPEDSWRGGEDRYAEPFVTVDGAGTLYVSDAKGQRIVCLGQDGQVQKCLGRSGAGAGEFDSPKGLAFAPDGELYVSDQLNNRFHRVRLQ